ncbi:uncharacterized protein V2V93DRAFT_385611 [Kockiozyma suomiensis]|uniref:uncharacterized protein n=1 Tax=Kockiozyma suomiensis TaxID=1337062 RepID=UPI003343A536
MNIEKAYHIRVSRAIADDANEATDTPTATFTPTIVQSTSYVVPHISGAKGFPKGAIVVFALLATAFTVFGYILIRSGARRKGDKTWVEQNEDAKRQLGFMAQKLGACFRGQKNSIDIDDTVSQIEARERLYGNIYRPTSPSEFITSSKMSFEDDLDDKSVQIWTSDSDPFSYSPDAFQELEDARLELEKLRLRNSIIDDNFGDDLPGIRGADQLPLIVSRKPTPSRPYPDAQSIYKVAREVPEPVSILELEHRSHRTPEKGGWHSSDALPTPTPPLHVYHRDKSKSPEKDYPRRAHPAGPRSEYTIHYDHSSARRLYSSIDSLRSLSSRSNSSLSSDYMTPSYQSYPRANDVHGKATSSAFQL